ncbi:MAG: TRAP transporter substrate-binding protein [Pseudolabrys sp.]|jgi:tripartite ATP-independent transporter DctP family solute receptor
MPKIVTTRRSLLALAGAAAAGTLISAPRIARAAQVTLRYGHMNSPTSVVGEQAQWFADAVAKNTSGALKIEVFPSSQLGSIKELAEGVSTGTIALSHNTAGALSSLYNPMAALDTPYLYRDVDHLMKVVAAGSPVMQYLNKGLIGASGVRVLYAFYFGTRELTLNHAVKQPSDLKGVKVRAIPSPIYLTAVQGLGAVPVPVDWSEVPTALATGVVSGQENPVNVVLTNKLYEVQSHMMLTGHIKAAELVVVNEGRWKALSPAFQQAIMKAADTARARATKTTLDNEGSDRKALAAKGMKIIGPEQGLKLDLFEKSVKALVDKKFGDKYGKLYAEIAKIA